MVGPNLDPEADHEVLMLIESKRYTVQVVAPQKINTERPNLLLVLGDVLNEAGWEGLQFRNLYPYVSVVYHPTWIGMSTTLLHDLDR